jgi:hypothetical protein
MRLRVRGAAHLVAEHASDDGAWTALDDSTLDGAALDGLLDDTALTAF